MKEIILLCFLIFVKVLSFNFSVALITDVHVNETPMRINYLEGVIKRINDAIETDLIKYVFIGGDLIDDGEEEGYIKAVSVLNQLAVPYFTIPGNHDGIGDGRIHFHNYFSDGIISHALNYTGHFPVSGDNYAEHYIINFGNAYFFFMDWAFIDDGEDEHYVEIEGNLNSIGLSFLKDNLNKYKQQNESRFYMIQHFPLNAQRPIFPQSMWGLDDDERKTLFSEVFEPLLPSYENFFGSVFCGHIHAPSTLSPFEKEEFQRKLPSHFKQYTLETSKYENAFYVASFDEDGRLLDLDKRTKRTLKWEMIVMEMTFIIGFLFSLFLCIMGAIIIPLFLTFTPFLFNMISKKKKQQQQKGKKKKKEEEEVSFSTVFLNHHVVEILRVFSNFLVTSREVSCFFWFCIFCNLFLICQQFYPSMFFFEHGFLIKYVFGIEYPLIVPFTFVPFVFFIYFLPQQKLMFFFFSQQKEKEQQQEEEEKKILLESIPIYLWKESKNFFSVIMGQSLFISFSFTLFVGGLLPCCFQLEILSIRETSESYFICFLVLVFLFVFFYFFFVEFLMFVHSKVIHSLLFVIRKVIKSKFNQQEIEKEKEEESKEEEEGGEEEEIEIEMDSNSPEEESQEQISEDESDEEEPKEEEKEEKKKRNNGANNLFYLMKILKFFDVFMIEMVLIPFISFVLSFIVSNILFIVFYYFSGQALGRFLCILFFDYHFDHFDDVFKFMGFWVNATLFFSIVFIYLLVLLILLFRNTLKNNNKEKEKKRKLQEEKKEQEEKEEKNQTIHFYTCFGFVFFGFCVICFISLWCSFCLAVKDFNHFYIVFWINIISLCIQVVISFVIPFLLSKILA